MHIVTIGYNHLQELKLLKGDLFIDIREDLPLSEKFKTFGVHRRVQKVYLKQKGVKEFYKKHVLEKVEQKIKRDKTRHFNIYISDWWGKTEAVVLAEKLERDLIKRYQIYSTVYHTHILADVK